MEQKWKVKFIFSTSPSNTNYRHALLLIMFVWCMWRCKWQRCLDTAMCRNGPRIQRYNSTRCEADLCVRRGNRTKDHGDYSQGVRRCLLCHEFQTYERWYQLRVADGRGGCYGSQGSSETVLPLLSVQLGVEHLPPLEVSTPDIPLGYY